MVLTPPLCELPAPVFFLSDAHLGASYIPDPLLQLDRLERLLDRVAAEGRSLILVGDLFDFWYEWRSVVPKRHFHILSRLHELRRAGIEIHYLAGNHDFRLHGFLESDVGLRVHQDSLDATVAGQRIYIFHGDGILSGDHGYRLLKRILRSRWAQFLFGKLHPDWAMRLASGTSSTSRTYRQPDPREDEEYLAFARGKLAEGYGGVVMGHTHRPVEYEEQGRVYVNLGDWIHHFTYGVHDGGRLHLEQWIDAAAKPHPDRLI